MLPDFSKARVLVIGDVMLDRYVWGEVSRISPEAPVPVLQCREKTGALGGAGNVAANLAGLGATVRLCGLRGRDASGLRMRQMIEAQGIIDCCLGPPGFETITKTRIMARHQQLLRLDEERNEAVSEDLGRRVVETVQAAISPGQVVVLSDYAKGMLTPPVCRGVISHCRSLGSPVLVDPKGLNWKKYRQAQCLTPNTQEFTEYARLESGVKTRLFAEARAVLSHLGLEALLLTRGQQGMALIRPETPPREIVARAREVFDVSGAGDTVIATLAGCLAAGSSWEQGAELANRAAGIVVGKLGTRAVSREELALEVSREHWGAPRVLSARNGLETIGRWRRQGQRIVFTNGCFDVLHPGHIKLLGAAASQGDRLVVGLNSDASVARLKGPQRPILNQEDRAAILSALESVDLVIVFEEDTPLKLIEAIKPEVLVKGGDYADRTVVGREVVEAAGGRVVLVDLEAGPSTTRLLETIINNAK